MHRVVPYWENRTTNKIYGMLWLDSLRNHNKLLLPSHCLNKCNNTVHFNTLVYIVKGEMVNSWLLLFYYCSYFLLLQCQLNHQMAMVNQDKVVVRVKKASHLPKVFFSMYIAMYVFTIIKHWLYCAILYDY